MSSTVADLFDSMAATYDDLEPWYEHFYARLHTILRAELGQAPPGGCALDAGCGTGFQSAILTDLGWTTHGIDLSAGLLAVARQRLPKAALAQASVEALPFIDASFDAVVCCGSTLSFVDDPARALSELGRVLRPGGRLLLDCEHRPSLDLAWTLASAVAGDPLGYGVSARAAWRAVFARDGVRLPYPGYGLLRLFRRRELDRLLADAGLRPVRAWGLHGVTNLLPSVVLHRPRPPRGLAAAYRALCRLDAALTTTAPALAFANSLALLAVRAQPSA